MTYPGQPYESQPGDQHHPEPQPHFWPDNPPPPVDPRPAVNYPEYPAAYPPPTGAYPPPYQASPPAYPGYPGYLAYSGVPPYPDPYDPFRRPSTPGTNGLAIGSLVASIAGFPLLFVCYSGVAGWIAGIVLGIVALNQIKQTNQEGRGLAIGGIALGAVALVFGLIALMVLLLVLARSSV